MRINKYQLLIMKSLWNCQGPKLLFKPTIEQSLPLIKINFASYMPSPHLAKGTELDSHI